MELDAFSFIKSSAKFPIQIGYLHESQHKSSGQPGSQDRETGQACAYHQKRLSAYDPCRTPSMPLWEIRIW